MRFLNGFEFSIEILLLFLQIIAIINAGCREQAHLVPDSRSELPESRSVRFFIDNVVRLI